jgi:hypothetical protein
MMNKTLSMLVLVATSTLAHADVAVSLQAGTKPMILRKESNVYSVPGEGEIRTVNCTVSSHGELSARVERGSKPWLYFYDRNGRREADCQIATRPAPVVTVESKPIQRAVATVE